MSAIIKKNILETLVLEVGYKYRINFGKNNPNNKTVHIRAIVDVDKIVYCRWVPAKQLYYYEVENFYYFELIAKSGNIKRIGKSYLNV